MAPFVEFLLPDRNILLDPLDGVTRGLEGFGANSRVHTLRILRLSEDLPVVIDSVDDAERIATFLPELDVLVQEGLITLEKVQVIAYRHNGQADPDDE